MNISDILSKVPGQQQAILWHVSQTQFVSFTYAQLSDAASRVCTLLGQESPALASKDGFGENFHGVLLTHGPPIVAVLMGCMQANQPFVCIDPSAHPITISQQLRIFDVSLVFVDATQPFNTCLDLDADFTLTHTLTDLLDSTVCVHRRRPCSSASPLSFRLPILFGVCTSGSTGAPKALAVPTQCFMPNITALEQRYRITATDRVYLSAPPTFDPFLLDLLIALRAGATAVLVASQLRHSPELLIPLLFDNPIASNRVTIMPLTPSLLNRLHDALLCSASTAASLRLLIVGGEPLSEVGLLQRLRYRRTASAALRVLILYGLTEISCWSMAYEMRDCDFTAQNGSPPLGTLLDPECSWSLYDAVSEADLTPPFEAPTVGELILHSPQRFTYPIGSDDKFLLASSPLHTGDLVEHRADGHLYYLTRGDRQIKRHGVRVCTAAVERHCRQSAVPGVLAVRCVWLDGALLLFVRCDAIADRPAGSVRAAVLAGMRRMPPTQVPDEVHCTHEWPLTRHGKFDWHQLTAELNAPRAKMSLDQRFEQHVIDRFRLSGDDWRSKSFPSLGGTSFEAMYAVNKLTQQQGCHQRSMPSDLLGMLLDGECPVLRIIERLQSVIGGRTDLATIDDSTPAAPAQIRWSVNMAKCIDATATVLSFGGHEYIAIGSHSHRLLTLRAADGSVQCSQQLPGRIEARVRRFGSGTELSWAACGCYDGSMYAYDFMSGERLWSVRCGAMIKTRPLWLPASDVLLWCSYLADAERSCNVWCVDAQTGVRRWRLRLGEKSICASPIGLTIEDGVHEDVMVCTLDGTVARLRARDGAIVWRKQLAAAVFGTPCRLAVGGHQLMVVSDVSGMVHCLDGIDGTERWMFKADGNIFSSFATLNEHVMFGCQDGQVYCLSAEHGGALQWRCKLDAPVYATPLLLRVGRSGEIAERSSLLAGSTAGLLVRLDVSTGGVLHRCRLPSGEMFSSPVELSDGSVVVGSRNDFVYCVDVQ